MQRAKRISKYAYILRELDRDTLYTPGTIVTFAEAFGLLKSTEPGSLKNEKTRIRINMGRLSNNHDFPDVGDGMVNVKGQSPIPGWFGWRWQLTVKSKNEGDTHA